MQLRDVQVTKRHDGLSTVLFLGQGGESIEVCLADADGDPVDRARAIMTQIASFDLGGEDGEEMVNRGSTDGSDDDGFEPGESPLPDRDI